MASAKVETVSLRYGLVIRVEDALPAAERCDQHHQRRTRQVEVRDQALDDTKPMPGMNEEVGYSPQ